MKPQLKIHTERSTKFSHHDISTKELSSSPSRKMPRLRNNIASFQDACHRSQTSQNSRFLNGKSAKHVPYHYMNFYNKNNLKQNTKLQSQPLNNLLIKTQRLNKKFFSSMKPKHPQQSTQDFTGQTSITRKSMESDIVEQPMFQTISNLVSQPALNDNHQLRDDKQQDHLNIKSLVDGNTMNLNLNQPLKHNYMSHTINIQNCYMKSHFDQYQKRTNDTSSLLGTHKFFLDTQAPLECMPHRWDRKSKNRYKIQMKHIDRQFPTMSDRKATEMKRLAGHWKETEKCNQNSINSRDINSQLVTHGKNGDRRQAEEPIKYIKNQGQQKFNNSLESLVIKSMEKGACYKINDVYKLNQIFGLPREIDDKQQQQNRSLDYSLETNSIQQNSIKVSYRKTATNFSNQVMRNLHIQQQMNNSFTHTKIPAELQIKNFKVKQQILTPKKVKVNTKKDIKLFISAQNKEKERISKSKVSHSMVLSSDLREDEFGISNSIVTKGLDSQESPTECSKKQQSALREQEIKSATDFETTNSQNKKHNRQNSQSKKSHRNEKSFIATQDNKRHCANSDIFMKKKKNMKANKNSTNRNFFQSNPKIQIDTYRKYDKRENETAITKKKSNIEDIIDLTMQDEYQAAARLLEVSCQETPVMPNTQGIEYQNYNIFSIKNEFQSPASDPQSAGLVSGMSQKYGKVLTSKPSEKSLFASNREVKMKVTNLKLDQDYATQPFYQSQFDPQTMISSKRTSRPTPSHQEHLQNKTSRLQSKKSEMASDILRRVIDKQNSSRMCNSSRISAKYNDTPIFHAENEIQILDQN